MRRMIAAIAAVTLLAGPVWAADGDQQDMEQAVTLSPVALPVVVGNRLANYVFVTAKVLLTPQADVFTLRDKEPYFRDALVRAAHRTPFVRAGDYNHLDEGRLKASLYREATAIVGPGKIAGVVVLSETAQHRVAAPRPTSGAPIEP
jgi:hypothetical protein